MDKEKSKLDGKKKKKKNWKNRIRTIEMGERKRERDRTYRLF